MSAASSERATAEPAPLVPLRPQEREGPGPLPVPFTLFVGREREVAAVCEMVRAGTIRLLTLTGPGGVGKTRLALRVATALEDDFADGIVFVPLAPLRDPGLLLPTVAQTLGVREAAGRPLAEALAAFLRSRHLLLVLDNFEPVVDAAPALAGLLAACPAVTALVTSRERLRVSGERAFPVPPLTLPERSEGGPPSPERLAETDAVRLFLDRAQAVKADFALTPTNAATVATICARLDGLPLAIELAAARISHLTPAALLARLEHRLLLLTGGAIDQPGRHQTMRAAIAWSHDLLSPDEQALFARLAVFTGGFTLAAAEAIASAEYRVLSAEHDEPTPQHSALSTQHSVLDGIASLVDKSLLRVGEGLAGGPEAGSPRYGMLETIREYGLEQLATSGEEDAIRQAHATYFVALAKEARAAYEGVVEPAWLDHVEAEHDNMRSALAWLEQSGDAARFLALAGALVPFWSLRSYRTEGRAWLARALAHAEGAPPDARVLAISGAAGLAFTQGDYEPAASLAEESLAHWREMGNAWGMAASLNLLGAVARGQGAYDQAVPRFEEALAFF